MLILSMMGGMALSGHAQEGLESLTQLIHQFATAGDRQDVAALDKLLHADYRVVWNNAAEGKLTVLNREVYLNMVREKKIGGDQRTVSIESVELSAGGNALVKTSIKGKQADFQSLFSLVQGKDGDWLLVQDQVYMRTR